MNCCDSMLKYIVFLCNFIFFLTGCAVLGIGIYVQLTMSDYYDFLEEKYFGSSIILMVVGGVILIVAFFGCCGACTENACMMYTFGTLIALILLVEIGCTVAVFLFKDEVWTAIKEQLTSGLKNYDNEDNKGMADSWDQLQTQMQCCGVGSYSDWSEVQSFNSSSSVPDSCCMVDKVVENCGAGQLTAPTTIYTEGCLAKFGAFITENLFIVAIAGAAVVVLQIIGVIVACCLGRRMKELQNYV